MSIEVCVLASGSAGNCTVVRSPGGVVLIDAGIGPRTAAQRMTGTGVAVADVSAICLTHLDRDHFNFNWLSTIDRNGVRLFCHANRAGELASLARARGFDPTIETFDGDGFVPADGVCFQPIHLPHDRAGSHGFIIEGFGCRLGYATDLGRVPPELVERFADVDLLAIESNYDPRMQADSPRPWFLKRRITGGRGHLSNEEALAAVRAILDRRQSRGRRPPAHIVLLHRSRQCNCPHLVRRLFSRDARIAPRLTLAEQYERSEWLRLAPSLPPLVGEQLTLAWG